MRRLRQIIPRVRRGASPIELTQADRREPRLVPGGQSATLDVVASEIEAVARYVAGLKREIGELRPVELEGVTVPDIREALRRTREDVAHAVHAIIGSAEAALDHRGSDDEYRAEAQARLAEIIEACSFHDHARERLVRAETLLESVQARLSRFVSDVPVADGAAHHRGEAVGDAGRQTRLVDDAAAGSGPQADFDLRPAS